MHTTHSPVGPAPASLPGVRGLWNGLAQRLEALGFAFRPPSVLGD